jgi:hypothetical protein
MRWTRHVTRMGEKSNACRILVGKQEGKRLLGRARRSWVDIIKMDLRQIECDGVDWIDTAPFPLPLLIATPSIRKNCH